MLKGRVFERYGADRGATTLADAPDRTIVGMIVQQALALGFIGFGIGAALILSIKDHFPRRVVLEQPLVVEIDGDAQVDVLVDDELVVAHGGVHVWELAERIDDARPQAGSGRQVRLVAKDAQRAHPVPRPGEVVQALLQRVGRT